MSTPLPSSRTLVDLAQAALRDGRVEPAGGEALLTLWRCVAVSQVPALDERWRDALRQGWWGWTAPVASFQPDPFDPRTLRPWLAREAEMVAGNLGLLLTLACHPDGRVREAAVHLLARRRGPLSTALLLVRAVDWVPQVRAPARQALRERLTTTELTDWVRGAALLSWQAGLERGDPELAAAAQSLLRTAEGQQVIREEVAQVESATRLALLQVVAGLPDAERRSLLTAFQADPAATIRRRVAQLMNPEQLEPFLRDRDAGVREVALTRQLHLVPPDEVPDFLLVALLDHQSSVRALAQFEARRRGVDVAAWYVGQEEGKLRPLALRGWVAGVREAHAAVSEERVRSWHGHPNARVRLEVMYTLGVLTPERHVDLLAQGLLASSREAQVAARLLEASGQLSVPLLQVLWPQALLRQRMRLVRLAARLPRFEAATLLLGWRSEAEPEITAQIDLTVTALLEGAGRTYYIRPTAAQQAWLQEGLRSGAFPEALVPLVQRLSGQ